VPILSSSLFRKALLLVGLLAVIGLVIVFFVLLHFDRMAARYDISAVGRVPMESVIYDASATAIGYIHQNKGSDLSKEEISPDFLQALIAREDSRFWKHGGVDYIGMGRAWLRNAKDKDFVQGASTITMQLSRMSFELRERSIKRKLLEMALARRIERAYSKDEILLGYANRVFLGTGMHGIEQAANGYFGKKPSDLNLAESAMLAGIIRAPNGFSPFRSPRSAKRELHLTLSRMEAEKFITKEEGQLARTIEVTVLPEERWRGILKEMTRGRTHNYFVDQVRREVSRLLPGSEGYGGLVVQTTVDHRVQIAAQKSVQTWLSRLEQTPGYPHPVYPAKDDSGAPISIQGAAVVVDNHTGGIRAMVGGRDYGQSQYNRAIYPNRQAGSIIKPLVYATAFETGLFPGSLVSDEKITPKELSWFDDKTWDPVNSDGVHEGLKTVEEGLIKSRNTMSVRIGESAGIDNVLTMLERAGIDEKPLEKNPQLYLGNHGVSLRAVTSAYTAFAIGGKRQETYLIETITDRSGKVIYQHAPEEQQMFSEESAWMMSQMLRKVVEQGGTGARLRQWGFSAPAGGKTGTTDEFVDAWFVGFTSNLTAGIWVGMDQPEPIAEGAYGGAVALPIWQDIMEGAAEIGYPFQEFGSVEDLFEVNLCRYSARMAHQGCINEGCSYVEKVPDALIPKKFCDVHKKP
ncbi:MAG: transglycosylase domain-containing protein, partial [Verrucomicrobiota bacterium]